MATLTIRGIEEDLKQKLRLRAAQHGRSMEAEVRTILREALDVPPIPPDVGFGTWLHSLFADIGGWEFEQPDRGEEARGAEFPE